MQKARSAFGIVYLNLYIYAIGGIKGDPSCERFSILDQKWHNYEPLPYYLVANTAVTFYNRLIYSVGGFNYEDLLSSSHNSYIDILRKDTFTDHPWESLKVINTSLFLICQVGLIPYLDYKTDDLKILAFGGLKYNWQNRDLSEDMHLITLSE
mmetsp:Transcript_42498/g.40751  ORF Transcript_42498/g.40751 Transcript_42498/m.40751 type:complete len:153 (-) Transcript_42498:278-736(-)